MKKKDSLIRLFIVVSFMIGVLIGAFFVMFLISFDIGNIIENNGLIYKDKCPVQIEKQPILLCSNYTKLGDYYYCNIDNVINITN